MREILKINETRKEFILNNNIVEFKINKEYEKKVEEEFTSYVRNNKGFLLREFIDSFAFNNKDENDCNLKLMSVKPIM